VRRVDRLGGDGFLLHVMHRHAVGATDFRSRDGGVPQNRFKADGLVSGSAPPPGSMHPLAMRAVTTSGRVVEAQAFSSA
jgi:hypothetical protein